MALMSQPSRLLAKFLMAWVREPGGVNQRLMVSGVSRLRTHPMGSTRCHVDDASQYRQKRDKWQPEGD